MTVGCSILCAWDDTITQVMYVQCKHVRHMCNLDTMYRYHFCRPWRLTSNGEWYIMCLLIWILWKYLSNALCSCWSGWVQFCVDCYRNEGFYLLFISYFPKFFEQTKHGKMNTVKLFPQQTNIGNHFLPCFPWCNQTHWKHFPYRKIFSHESILHLEMNLHKAKRSL